MALQNIEPVVLPSGCRIVGFRANVGREINIEIGYFFTDDPRFFYAS